MTQGGKQAYGASARPAPELETPPLLHYILPLTQEGQLHAPLPSFRVIILFTTVLAHLSDRKCADSIYKSFSLNLITFVTQQVFK